MAIETSGASFSISTAYEDRLALRRLVIDNRTIEFFPGSPQDRGNKKFNFQEGQPKYDPEEVMMSSNRNTAVA